MTRRVILFALYFLMTLLATIPAIVIWLSCMFYDIVLAMTRKLATWEMKK